MSSNISASDFHWRAVFVLQTLLHHRPHLGRRPIDMFESNDMVWGINLN